ncbi:hypothetical protein [Neobacillus endophyticus]|uniref:hypothetical protein n=1 Tax=Neobacillus endophyticus TaxID=2738405 RepID=UPI001C277987|nr:hypothetical protein [Neobacillus endophyticus]
MIAFILSLSNYITARRDRKREEEELKREKEEQEMVVQEMEEEEIEEIRQYLNALNKNENKEERLVYQVMDLQLIKYRGIQTGDIVPNDKVAMAIDKSIEGFIWLYEKGYSLERNIKELVKDEEEKLHYEEMMNAFAVLNDFMSTHMALTR